jgi:hypothetical protein
MKKIGGIVFAALMFIACTEKSEITNLELSGKVKGLYLGKLYVKKIVDTNFVTLDSISIDGDSNFKTALQINEPEMLYLFLDRGKTNSIDNNIPFFAEPGKMEITTNLENFFYDAEIKGSKNQDAYKEFMNIHTKFKEQELALLDKKIQNEFKKANNSLDSINKAYESIIKRKYRFVANYANQNGSLAVSPYIAITEIPDINTMYLDSISKNMTPEIAKSKYGKLLKQLIKERKQQ